MLLTGAPTQTLQTAQHSFLIVELLDRFCEREQLFDVFDLLMCLKRRQRISKVYDPGSNIITLIIDGYRVRVTFAQLREAVDLNYRRRDEQELLDRFLRSL